MRRSLSLLLVVSACVAVHLRADHARSSMIAAEWTDVVAVYDPTVEEEGAGRSDCAMNPGGNAVRSFSTLLVLPALALRFGRFTQGSEGCGRSRV